MKTPLVVIALVTMGLGAAAWAAVLLLASVVSPPLEDLVSAPAPGQAVAYIRAHGLGSGYFGPLQESLSRAMEGAALPDKRIDSSTSRRATSFFGDTLAYWERAFPVADDFGPAALLDGLQPVLVKGDWAVGSVIMGIRHRPADPALLETGVEFDVGGAFFVTAEAEGD
ncbi:MAG: hypothetical protein CMK00_06835 [Planctomycetes bacterium]|jgi:hypothetical protein|nr:hypothetical protein [Planctomycetota bacterium]HJO26388.1 hypothetical protein [Planctomycetota bacterium]